MLFSNSRGACVLCNGWLDVCIIVILAFVKRAYCPYYCFLTICFYLG